MNISKNDKKFTQRSTQNYREQSIRPTRKSIIALWILVAILSLAACGSETSGDASSNAGNSLDQFQTADMSEYQGLNNYEKELQFVDVTVKDVEDLMANNASFVLYAGFSSCPWCNAMISTLNDQAIEAGQKIAYIDTRRDPAWSSNVDIDDYDIFAERFGDWLEVDDDGIPHLYVPDVYFIKAGQVVDRHDGVIPSLESPTDPMTDEQREELGAIYRAGFEKIA